MGTIIKTVKQYSYELDKNSLKELETIGIRYRNAKNYIYSRFSGISSILLIEKPRDIRDNWVKSSFPSQWKLPARYWKLALSEVISNIKSTWSNIKKKIREVILKNQNLSKEEIHYINYALKASKLYYKVLINEEFEIPKIFSNKKLSYKYLNRLIRRLTRKYKGKISYTKKLTFSLDTGLYSYKNGCINITTTKKGQRLSIKLTDNNVYDRTLTVKFKEKRIEIHCPLKIKTKNNNYNNVIGIDKGYKYLFATSSEKLYGKHLNDYLNVETERLNNINSKRNRFYALKNKHLEDGNLEKANNIIKNNLGKIKYNKNKSKHDERVKSYINHSINKLMKHEKPKEIIMEQLDFVNWNDKYPKSIKRKLSRWIKGYIRERIEYKCNLNGIKFIYINPAYTSKICNICNSFGERKNDIFKCKNCGEIHADVNASKNILKRKDDKEITLYTPYRKVKEILISRAN